MSFRPAVENARPGSRDLSLRWVAVTVFILSSTLNYLDRNLIAVLAPLILAEFQLKQTGFGLLISAFSFAYAGSSLLVGWFLDRVGINRGISAAVGWWSAAAVGSGLVRTLPGLTFCRVALGIGEAAGVPAVGKLNGLYLKAEERAMGAALNQVGLSLGAILAPLWIGVAYRYSWRAPFVVVGLLGFLWIPLWLWVNRLIRPAFGSNGGTIAKSIGPECRADQYRWMPDPATAGFRLLLDRKLILLVVANVLWMGAYSLWSNWITLYLTKVQGLTLKQSAAYVWIPPLVSNAGGFFGGWLSQKWMRRGSEAVAARCRAVAWSAAGMLVTLLLPFASDAVSATAVISLSFFFALAGSVNIYAIPIDLYGPARSGLAISTLVFAFGVLQTLISPLIGYLADHHLYTAVVWIVTVPPLLTILVLRSLEKLHREHEAQ
jgi:MFS transporter, ACS family, hexuronate transporter